LTRLRAVFGMITGLASPEVETPGSAGGGMEYLDGIGEGKIV
jgi:hypothetical protein